MKNELLEGKEIVEIDLKNNVDEAYELVKKCDILVENFGIDVLKNLGLSYEKCSEINSKIIYISVPGFASTDLQYKKLRLEKH